MKLIIETNCREHFPLFELRKRHFQVQSQWYSGECNITTYEFEELLGTKLRALYQRKRGRDLYDLYAALNSDTGLSRDKILQVYNHYIGNEVTGIPSSETFLRNLEAKMHDPEFLGDTIALLSPGIIYDPFDGFQLVKRELIDIMR